MPVIIRASTTIKLGTEKSRLDYVYPKGAAVEDVAKDLLHAVIMNKGTQGAKDFINEFIATYKPDYLGYEAPLKQEQDQ